LALAVELLVARWAVVAPAVKGVGDKARAVQAAAKVPAVLAPADLDKGGASVAARVALVLEAAKTARAGQAAPVVPAADKGGNRVPAAPNPAARHKAAATCGLAGPNLAACSAQEAAVDAKRMTERRAASGRRQPPDWATIAIGPNSQRIPIGRLTPAARQESQPARLAKRRAMILILVLIVIVILSLGAYSFTDLMLAHHEAAQLTGRQIQARALVESGVDAVRLFLGQTKEQRLEAGGIFNNVESFRGVTLIPDDNPADRGSFSVIAPNFNSDGYLEGVRHGLEDESTRLNLNTLLHAEQLAPGTGRQLLMALPGMTEEIADAILDWIDADDEPRELGAEIDYYSGLTPAYAPKNGPLETVEELLLVRGVTPQLLFGADINRNGMLDSHELDADATGVEAADLDPSSFRGWSAYLTLYSLEWNVNPDGQPRIYLNEPDLNKLYEQLSAVFPPEWTDFIIAYRQAGPYQGTGPVTGGASGQLNMQLQAKAPIAQVLDLVGAKVQYTFQGATQTSILASPFGPDLGSMNTYMPTLMDHVTVNPAATIPGRININQASKTVLLGIPGMSPDIASQIVSRRDVETTDDKPNRRHETWLVQEGVVTLDEMRQMMPFITAGGDVYRCQVVGYFQGGQASSRAEVVIDATYTLPRLLFWRDISHLGRGYAIETLGVSYTESSP
jgi:hypothetical protein